MKNYVALLLVLFFNLSLTSVSILAQTANDSSHPKLILTQKGIDQIRANLGKVHLFDSSLAEIKKEIDHEIELGIQVPIPKDFSGGYTHERHKYNFLVMQKAGVLYQILEDDRYANYVRDMLFQYEKIYKTLPPHPQTRSYARGKIFWQCLNDSNWLVYVSQAYDCIYNYLSEDEREKLETNLFKPFADYISIGNPQFFNRVHNHSTWGNAAVGMIALVMDDDELLQRALYGIPNDNISSDIKDNDGGFIKNEDGKAGFLANLEEPFSPDGYYTEGPYYQRYAMYPFLIFAEALQNVKPELKIFEYKDGVLLKSVNTLLQLSDADGEFFPINDGQKGMSYYSRELVTAVDIAYFYGGQNPNLLSIASKQNKVLLDDAGMSVALGIKNGKSTPFEKKSINLSDGPDGSEGGLGILRYNNEELTVLFKYAAQGLSHGHYDKLSFSLYSKGNEVIQDYGLARFVNIEQKGGGNYLKENKTWAKQTVAHNTVVQDGTSHFEGKYEIGSKHHSDLYYFNVDNEHFQIISAKENNAYPDTQLQRTMAIINDPLINSTYVLDVYKIDSPVQHQYDLPYYFLGQVITTGFEYTTTTPIPLLGDKNGYQHLWEEGKGIIGNEETASLTWLDHGKFFTLTSSVQPNDELLFVRLGANDPKFNLRRDAALIQRRKEVKQTLFANIIEPHGGYSPVSEFAVESKSNIKEIKVLFESDSYSALNIHYTNGKERIFILSNQNADIEANHSLTIEEKKYTWKGVYYFK